MTNRPITKVEFEWMANRLIYLATPYSYVEIGFAAAAHKAASIAARLCRATHGAVFSPIVHGHQLAVACQGDSLTDTILWEPLNDRMLEGCDVLVVAHMDQWEQSIGIAKEILAFQTMGKPIFDLVDLQNLRMERRQPTKPPRDRIEDRSPTEVNDDARQFLAAR